MTFDLDLWPTDLNINRGHLLIKDYLPTKFEASWAKHTWVISCTMLRDTDIPTYRPTDIPTYRHTDRHVQINMPFLFQRWGIITCKYVTWLCFSYRNYVVCTKNLYELCNATATTTRRSLDVAGKIAFVLWRHGQRLNETMPTMGLALLCFLCKRAHEYPVLDRRPGSNDLELNFRWVCAVSCARKFDPEWAVCNCWLLALFHDVIVYDVTAHTTTLPATSPPLSMAMNDINLNKFI